MGLRCHGVGCGGDDSWCPIETLTTSNEGSAIKAPVQIHSATTAGAQGPLGWEQTTLLL